MSSARARRSSVLPPRRPHPLGDGGLGRVGHGGRCGERRPPGQRPPPSRKKRTLDRQILLRRTAVPFAALSALAHARHFLFCRIPHPGALPAPPFTGGVREKSIYFDLWYHLLRENTIVRSATFCAFPSPASGSAVRFRGRRRKKRRSRRGDVLPLRGGCAAFVWVLRLRRTRSLLLQGPEQGGDELLFPGDHPPTAGSGRPSPGRKRPG
jgi:hypothetical protein